MPKQVASAPSRIAGATLRAGTAANAESRRTVLMPPPRAEPHDAVGPGLQLRAVRDQEDGAPGEQALDGRGDDLGARRVEIGGRLVQDHERGVAEECARERDPPDLAGRERPAAVADDRLVAVRQPAHEAVGAGLGGRLAHGRVRRAGVAQADVVGDRPAEERRPLRDPGHLRPPGSRIALREVDPADGHAPGGRLRQEQEQRRDRALPRPARARQRDRLARLELEVEVGDRRRGRVG